MAKKKMLIVVLGVLFTLLLAGCKCTQEQMNEMVIIHDTPADGTLLSSLLPSFSWHSTTCSPSYYYVFVYASGNTSLLSAYHQVPDGATSFDWVTPPLEPGKEYAWRVKPVLEDPGYMEGDFSEETIFYTGPVCSGETLVAPELQGPSWVEHNGPQEFNWTYPGSCLPISYDYQFASDIGFTDIILSGTTTELYAQHLNQTFPNCSSLFWRVAANDGTTVGPWSDALQFHWVKDETCWQLHYISDDAARIRVRLYDDICEMTGYSSSTRTILDPGCKKEKGTNLIHGDGEYAYPPDHTFTGFTVKLGSGPCPSTGLDSREFGGLQFFYVVAPGTYCVSITRDQEADSWGETKDLMNGMWTDPAGSGVIAEKTLELGSGLQDVLVEFGWDEYEQIILWYPIPENINCRRGPDTICDPLKIPMAGEILPILARDMQTEWKLTSYEGETCFVYLTDAQINEVLSKTPGNQLLTENLPFYEPQPPCPTPTPVPREPAPTGCAQYTTQRNCIAAKCQWTGTSCIPY